MTTDDAKTYLSKREIPRLFESLMTGLMYHRPGDHIKYLIDCLQKVHDKGQDNITWSSFVDIRRSKTPLPPIDSRRSSSKGSRPTSRTRTPKGDDIVSKELKMLPTQGDTTLSDGEIDTSFDEPSLTNNVLKFDNKYSEENSPRDVTQTEPLPAIPTTEKVTVPDVPMVIVMGAPGSNKEAHVEKLLTRYPGWEHINMGRLIKEEIKLRGDRHSKWKMIRDLLSKGEFVPEDVTKEVFIDALKKCSGAKGIVINGFPRSMVQVGDYDRVVGRVDCVIMLDCDEQQSLDKLLRKGKETGLPEDTLSSIARRLNYFKSSTLPAAKHYDDQGKLILIDGDMGPERVEYEFENAFDNLFLSKYGTEGLKKEEPPKSAGAPPPAPTYKGKYESEGDEEEEQPMFVGPVPEPPIIDVTDEGRKPDLPQCPIIFVAGGPGSGKGTQCEKIVQRYPGMVHLSMGDILRNEISTKGTVDEKWDMISQLLSKGEMAPEEDTVNLLKENLKKHMSAKAFLIEGFPRNKEQVEAFNKEIGGLNFVLLFDCEEYYMQNRLIKRGKESGRIDDNISAIAKKLHYYKHNTLPIMKYYDDGGKLVVLDADRDMEEMFFDISKLFDFAFYGDEKKPELPEDKKLAADAIKIEAAIKIQANYRGYKVRSGTWKKYKEAITDDDKLKLKEMETSPNPEKSPEGKQHWYQSSPSPTLETSRTSRDHDNKASAATKIQAGFQGYKVRKEAKKSSQKGQSRSKSQEGTEKEPSDNQTETDLDPAASKIQAGYRGYKTRSEVKARKEQAKRTDEAASRIQAGFHGYKVRSQHAEKKNKVKREQSPEVKDTSYYASSRIQAGYRGYKTRSEFRGRREKLQREKSQEVKDTDYAASRIQAGYRGYKTRSKFRGKRDKLQREPSPEVKDTHYAASRIQAGYRGYRTRSEFRSRQDKLQETKQASPEPAQEEVVEATITPQEGTTTGDDIANPSHTEKLDEIAKQEETSS